MTPFIGWQPSVVVGSSAIGNFGRASLSLTMVRLKWRWMSRVFYSIAPYSASDILGSVGHSAMKGMQGIQCKIRDEYAHVSLRRAICGPH